MTRLPILVERTFANVRATQIQLGLEHEQRVRQQYTVTCRAGCSNCCHHPFLISIVEGVLLYRWLVAHGRWTPSLRGRVEEARNKTLGLALEVWLLGNIPCPLLDAQRLCVAYAARPLNCRTRFSAGTPDACHPHALGSQPGLIDNSAVIAEFNSETRTKLRQLESKGYLMPLAEALTLGERLDNGTLEIENLDLEYAKDLVEEG